MTKYKCLLLIFILLFPLSYSTYAYNLRQISNRDGLSNSAILSICQDEEGFMWFGSCDGLNMFNGLSIQVYKPADDKNNLSGNLIENIIETQKGVLWIHTNYGLNRLDKRTQTIDSYNQFKGRYFIQKDNNGKIFIISEDESIYHYDEQSHAFKKVTIENLVYNNVLNFTITSNNILHIFMKDGDNLCFSMERLNGGSQRMASEQSPLASQKLLYCFYERDNKDIIYIIDEAYTLYEYNLVKNRKLYVTSLENEINKKGEVSSIIKQNNDYFIGFKTNGLLRLKNIPDRKENYEIEDVGIKSGIFCLLKDKYQDIVWVGTDGQGVYIYSNDSYIIKSAVFSHFARNIEKPVRALFLDKENTLWIGTKGDGILKIRDYDRNKNSDLYDAEYVTTGNSLLIDNTVYAFEKSSKDILWIGGESGLNYYSYKDRSIKNITLSVDGEPVKYIHSICELNDSTLWVATVGTGIIKAHISGTKDKPELNNVRKIVIHGGKESYNYFFTIYKGEQSELWFGNRGYGAFCMQNNSMELDSLLVAEEGDSQTLNDVFSIIKDKDSNLWLGTSFGLVKYSSDGEKRVYNEKEGFPNNTIHGILQDSHGNLWLSTNRGIVKFDTRQETFQVYSDLNGLQVLEFSDGASFKDDVTGDLFFGGINGFVSIAETGMRKQKYLPPVYFGNLMIFGEDRNIYNFLDKKESNTLELDYDQNFFSISFTALDYINGNNYTYYYKLGDLSKHWIDNGSSNRASFTSLSPGEYTLYIKYKNRLTGDESPVSSLTIKILPPWYLSAWAYLVYTVLVLGLIFFMFRSLRKRNDRKKREALEKLQQHHQKDVYESKLRFFTNIAHEFCTPLTLIYGPCNRILNHNGSDKFVKKYTNLIQRNAERLNDLIQDLIEFRRIETGYRTPNIVQLPIAEMIDDILSSFNDLAETRNIHIEKNISAKLSWNSDKNFLYTIISNLLSNAFKYVPQNGIVRIDARKSDENLIIEISNTGKGIKPENLPDIFNRYAILDDFEKQDGYANYSRNGLGLAIANSMVRLLDGKIDVASVVDEWTSFSVSLPQKDISSIVSEEPERKVNDIVAKKDYKSLVELPEYEFDKTKPTVLIVDDDIEMLWLISEIFAEEYNVIPLNDSLEIKQVLLKDHPDIIICDVMMPGIDGISLVKGIKSDKKTAHIPLILLSAKYTVEEQIEGLASGAEMYISKPFNTDYLKTSVRHLLSRKETLKDYFASPLSAFELNEGKLIHKESSKFVQDIYHIIEKNVMDKKLSAQFIAAEMNITTRQLYRRLSDVDCESPAEMIRECRLYIAHNFLLNSKMTIDEVIYKSGFSNRATFFRAFSQKYGCTPKEYREKMMAGL